MAKKHLASIHEKMYLEEVLPKVLANVKSTPQKRRLDDYDRKVISKASKKARLEDDSSADDSDLEEADDEFLKKPRKTKKKILQILHVPLPNLMSALSVTSHSRLRVYCPSTIYKFMESLMVVKTSKPKTNLT